MNKPYYETEEYSEAENELDTYDDKVKLVMEYRLSEKHKDQQIAELKKQLAEHNEFFNAFNCKNFNEFKDFLSTFMLAPHEEQTLIRELKQQLAEKDKENNELEFIVEEIEQFAWEQLNNDNFDKYKAYDEMYTKIKQLTKNSPYEKRHQDKISFAVEQLEKVKKFLLEKIAEKQSCFDSGNYNDFADGVKTICELILISIDNQIKSLKGEKR